MCTLSQLCDPYSYLVFFGIFLAIVWVRYKVLYLAAEEGAVSIFLTEAAFSLPYIGARLKAESIRQMIEGSGTDDGTISGTTRAWQYRELRETEQYAECGYDFYVKPAVFWTKVCVWIAVSLVLTVISVSFIK